MSIATKTELRKSILKLRDSIPPDVKEDLDERIAERVMSVFDQKIEASGESIGTGEASGLEGGADLRDMTVLTYVSFRSEVSTYGIIDRFLKAGVKVAVPRVEGEEIRFYYISSIDDLTEGYMGILEPKQSCRQWEMKSFDRAAGLRDGIIDTAVLVPGSVFDKKGNRIGYGGGFYDRFLAEHQGIYSIGLAYECQITDKIPADEWDRKVDMVITPECTCAG
ncbi:MAG: 5-formyltetrahydrofolate cyclo-ligase [Lachnospiraceae bacterium]|nr:5-formyltetrahydrofolate cyclo-ligase [Lachnospiraceae bacterium]